MAETYQEWQERLAAMKEHDRHTRNGTDPVPDCPYCRHSLFHRPHMASRFPILASDLRNVTTDKWSEDPVE